MIARRHWAIRWVTLAASFVALVVPVSLLSSGVSAAPAGEPTTIDQLQQIYEPKLPPSDFVVVIDTSGSMKQPPEDPRYPRVQAAFGQLVDAQLL